MRAATAYAIVAAALAAGVSAGTTPKYHTDPNTTPKCSFWWDNEGNYDCFDIPWLWDITPEDYIKWVSYLLTYM
jgi:hypothetical protein